MDGGPVVLFDGVCNLCARGVRFILGHEREDVPADERLRFAALQSEFARAELTRRGLDADAMDTMVVLDGERALVRSDAALIIAGYLRRPWRWARVARLLPRFLRDWVYGLVARSRYRVFGKSDSCLTPTAEMRERFVGLSPGGGRGGGERERDAE